MKTPQPATVLSTLALAVALTGTATAAGIIDGHSIKDHSIPASKLIQHSLTNTQIKQHSLTKLALDPSAVNVFATINAPAGPKGDQGDQGKFGVGPQGDPGAPGAPGPSGQDRVAVAVAVPNDASSATGSGTGALIVERAGLASTAPTCLQLAASVNISTAPIIVTPNPIGGGLYTAQFIRNDAVCPRGGEIGVYTINLNNGSPVFDAIGFSLVSP